MQIDFSSAAWLVLKEFLERELARLRSANDALNLSSEERGAMCGEIRLCKRLLALPEQASRDEAIRRSDPTSHPDWVEP